MTLNCSSNQASYFSEHLHRKWMNKKTGHQSLSMYNQQLGPGCSVIFLEDALYLQPSNTSQVTDIIRGSIHPKKRYHPQPPQNLLSHHNKTYGYTTHATPILLSPSPIIFTHLHHHKKFIQSPKPSPHPTHPLNHCLHHTPISTPHPSIPYIPTSLPPHIHNNPKPPNLASRNQPIISSNTSTPHKFTSKERLNSRTCFTHSYISVL